MISYNSSIEIKNKAEVEEILNQQLADTIHLHSQAKYSHWNVKGPNFYTLHQLFDDLASDLLGFTDDIAERITALGGLAKGNLNTVSTISRLNALPEKFETGSSAVEELAVRFAQLCKTTRKAIALTDGLEDSATADLFTEVVRGLDKGLWLLEAHQQ